MFSTEFWRALLERAIKTFCQSLVAVGLAGATDLLSVDWASALSVAGLATLLSVLTSVASSAVGDGGPSLTSVETLSSDPADQDQDDEPDYDLPAGDLGDSDNPVQDPEATE